LKLRPVNLSVAFIFSLMEVALLFQPAPRNGVERRTAMASASHHCVLLLAIAAAAVIILALSTAHASAADAGAVSKTVVTLSPGTPQQKSRLVVADAPPQSGSWIINKRLVDQLRLTWEVLIYSTVNRTLQCSVNWSGTAGFGYSNPTDSGGYQVNGTLGLLIPAYPGFGGEIIGHDTRSDLMNFNVQATCHPF
jgi:hypothetical protein